MATYRRICLSCRNEFLSRSSTRLYCRTTCQPAYISQQRAHHAVQALYDTTVPTGTIGSVGELAVSIDLMCKGYTVFRALSPASYCDLIARKYDVLWHLEVRTGHLLHDTLYFPKKRSEGVTCFAIWDRSTGAVTYLLPGSWTPVTL